MNSPTDTYLLLRAFVDELARCGMQAACTSPGSRSAPLVLTLAREPRLRCFSHVDERCSGFFALGLAKASGLPVAVACTSGTAAAELLPAAVEAREARVPLILLTADRPAELRENGAGQAVDQLKIFGSAAKWFFEVEQPAAGETGLRWMRTLACRAYATALEGAPGAVHLNFPLREPLVTDEPLPADPTARPDGRPYVARPLPSPPEPPQELLSLLAGVKRGVIVAGRHERDALLPAVAARLAEMAGWPLLADPMSGARRGDAAVAHYDSILRAGESPGGVPELILRVGDLPVSKPLRQWLASMPDVEQVALDPEFAWQDPASVLSRTVACQPAAALAHLAARAGFTPEEQWLQSWRAADELAGEALAGVLAADGLSEPAVARELGVLLPQEATLFVASSMPVRDVETFWPVRPDPPRVLCNRGANGIDGTVSSAFGAAAASEGPVVLLIGDVALAYDVGGLLAAGRLGLKLTIVLIDNGGGGIFDFLPVAGAVMARDSDGEGDVFTDHVATPTGLDFARAAELYGLQHERASDVRGFREALERALAYEGSAIVEVRSDRDGNVAAHRRLNDAVAAALSRPGEAAERPA
jgi:2-succinyl-5-enolpyruvyl-6-hydroxy-3-cyclohexene-1-carboxylate synthase